jgi:hypothetical protein
MNRGFTLIGGLGMLCRYLYMRISGAADLLYIGWCFMMSLNIYDPLYSFRSAVLLLK